MEIGVDPGYFFLATAVGIGAGMIVFCIRIFGDAGIGNALTLSQFFFHLSKWRHWFPAIKWYSLALLVDMFCVSLFSPGVVLYIYDAPYITFPWFHTKLPRDILLTIYDACFSIGDTISRRMFYPLKRINPLFFWAFSILGVAAGLSNISFLIPFCAFLVAFANGCIYAQANKYIDSAVAKDYSLIAFSFWLFIGDIGSVLGSNMISYISVDIKNLYH